MQIETNNGRKTRLELSTNNQERQKVTQALNDTMHLDVSPEDVDSINITYNFK